MKYVKISSGRINGSSIRTKGTMKSPIITLLMFVKLTDYVGGGCFSFFRGDIEQFLETADDKVKHKYNSLNYIHKRSHSNPCSDNENKRCAHNNSPFFKYFLQAHITIKKNKNQPLF